MKKLLIAVAAFLLLAVAGVTAWFNFAPAAHVAGVLVSLQREQAGMEERELQVPGFRIAYLEGGDGETLLLLHGMGGSKDNWNLVAQQLTPHFRVIAVDLPGFGDSDKPAERRYRAEDQATYVHSIVQALGLRRFNLGGISMGGRIAAEYAARYPDAITSLWLLAPGGVASARPSELAQHLEETGNEGGNFPLLVRTPADVDTLLNWSMASPPYIPAPVKQALADQAAASHDLHLRILGELAEEWEEVSLEEIVDGLETPTRIVWGARDRVLHVSGAEALRRHMPDASVRILPGVGHIPIIEAPETVASDYRSFKDSRSD
ncbi:MAG: alpha/beta fold hydrolase [Aquisalimonadaceae bacterium]